MPYKKITGIYKIINTKNNKVYVGSALSVFSRLNTHKNLNELFVNGELNNLSYINAIIDKLVTDNVTTKSKLLELFNLKEQDSKKDVFNKLNYHLTKSNTAPSGSQLAFTLLYKQYS